MTAGGEIQGWCIPVGIGITSFMMPPEKIAWSGWIYFAMAILVPLHSRFRRRLSARPGRVNDSEPPRGACAYQLLP